MNTETQQSSPAQDPAADLMGNRKWRTLGGTPLYIQNVLLVAITLLCAAWSIDLHHIVGLPVFKEQFLALIFALAMAAIRECFEEAGLLVACTAHAEVMPARREALRHALNTQTTSWAAIVTEMDLRFDLDALAFFAHWTTPAGPPKRYSTRFFAAAAPEGEAYCDGLETTHVWWAPPAQAVAAHDRGDIELMTPTRATLESLARYPDADTALAALMDATTVRVP